MDRSSALKAEKPIVIITVIRIYAGLLSLIFLLVFLHDIFLIETTSSHLQTAQDVICVLCTISLFCVCVKPHRWKLLASLHLIAGIMFIICSEYGIGYLLVTVSVICAHAYHFFTRFKRVKIISLFALVILGVSVRLVYFPQNRLMTVLQSGIYLLTISFILLLQNPKKLPELFPRNLSPAAGRRHIDLSLYEFSETELYAIRSILKSKSYAEIARELVISESVVKKMMVRIYKKFGCNNREIFMERIGRRTLLFPDKTGDL